MNSTKVQAGLAATGYIDHYHVHFDGDLPIAGSVRIGYRVIRPDNWRAHNPHHDSDIEWWVEEINELYVPTSAGRAMLDVESRREELIGMIVAALHDASASRACAKAYDQEAI